MATLYQASQQWASRPADQRFTSLTELNDYTHSVRDNSRAKCVSSRGIQYQVADRREQFVIIEARRADYWTAVQP